MLSFKNFIEDSIVYAPGMSDEETQARLWELRPRFFIESAGIADQYLFAGIPTKFSKEEIINWLHSLEFTKPPKFIPVPQLHLTIRFSYNTLVNHIEEIKNIVDGFAKFKNEYTIPVDKVSMMGRHKTLFGFEFPNHPTLLWAAKTFDIFVKHISKEPNLYAFRPHMKLAERVEKMPLIRTHPQNVDMYFAVVRGILNVE